MQPPFYLANAPRRAGVAAALFHLADHDDVRGWFTGARSHGCAAAHFVLEHRCAKQPTVFWHSIGDDVHDCRPRPEPVPL